MSEITDRIIKQILHVNEWQDLSRPADSITIGVPQWKMLEIEIDPGDEFKDGRSALVFVLEKIMGLKNMRDFKVLVEGGFKGLGELFERREDYAVKPEFTPPESASFEPVNNTVKLYLTPEITGFLRLSGNLSDFLKLRSQQPPSISVKEAEKLGRAIFIEVIRCGPGKPNRPGYILDYTLDLSAGNADVAVLVLGEAMKLAVSREHFLAAAVIRDSLSGIEQKKSLGRQ